MTWDYPPPPESLKVEKAPREVLQKIQSDQLKSLLVRTWDHIPFYRERWEKVGLRPPDVSGAGGIENLPVIYKRDLEESLRIYPPLFNELRAADLFGTWLMATPEFVDQTAISPYL